MSAMRAKGARAFRESTIVAFVAVPLFILAEYLEVFHWPVERTGGAIHELVFEAAFLALAFATFSWRRSKELREEIVERRRSEQALREMALFAELNPAPVVRFNKEGEVIFANPAAGSILGIEAREGAPLTSLLPGVGELDLERCVREGSVIGAEIAVGQRHFNLVIRGLPDLDIGHIYGSDITERKYAEETLRESEKRFRLLAENIDEVFWLLDPKDYQALYVSPSYEELWGRTCESLFEDPGAWLAGVHPADLERVSAANEKLAQTGEFDEEYRIIRSDGSIRWVWDRGSSVKDESGQVQLVVGIAADISERKRAEEALQQANEELEGRVAERTAELEKANVGLRSEISARKEAEAQLVHSARLAAVGQVAAGVAHEINNPLGAIVGYAQLISEDGALSPASKAQLERIIQRAQGAAKVVTELRAFAAPAEMEKASTDIHDVIERALSLVERQISLGNIAVVRDYGSGLPGIECDSDRIEQVLVNLMLNARDAMADGGSLTISTEVSGDGQGVTITVTDTGKGISKDDQAHIFEPFYTAGKKGGTGLGLSISHRIIEDHGGRIEIESEPGRGSRFIVWLVASAPEKVSQRAVA